MHFYIPPSKADTKMPNILIRFPLLSYVMKKSQITPLVFHCHLDGCREILILITKHWVVLKNELRNQFSMYGLIRKRIVTYLAYTDYSVGFAVSKRNLLFFFLFFSFKTILKRNYFFLLRSQNMIFTNYKFNQAMNRPYHSRFFFYMSSISVKGRICFQHTRS